MTKVLIISPHPDDETIGCGGSILRHKSNKDKVYWLAFTDVFENKGWDKNFVKNRKKEIKKIINQFKFDGYTNFNIPTKEIDKYNFDFLISKLNIYLKKIKPDTIYFPFSDDIHSDHQIISNVVGACIKNFRNKFVNRVFMYEVLSETNFNFITQNSFKPNYYLDISKFIKKKLDILKIYKSELKEHPFPRSLESVRSLAIIRGSESNFKFAESFKLIFFRK